MVGFREPIKFEFPKPTGKEKVLADILEDGVSGDHFLSQRYLDTLKKHRARHESKGNGFGFMIRKESDIANTIVLGGMGRERNLIVDKKSLRSSGRKDANDEAVRCLTPRECLRLQGFPDSFHIVVPKTQMFRQAANSVAVPVIKEIAKSMKKAISESKLMTVPIPSVA